ncbi:hypothetical protein C7974DRAFT_380824 [Boeremia exigua]|uniref:uncharacterized protein n=1 Tax=Boeremia exigua TaxID=749465 RepID=UPI001E8EDA99|nr:uncharacterized protein C7974DRAFT_380824 [Boeremia exigua]KAH6613113.1 hypothetical protein C7974DRAFT_380824 [Boeremia exigua]
MEPATEKHLRPRRDRGRSSFTTHSGGQKTRAIQGDEKTKPIGDSKRRRINDKSKRRAAPLKDITGLSTKRRQQLELSPSSNLAPFGPGVCDEQLPVKPSSCKEEAPDKLSRREQQPQELHLPPPRYPLTTSNLRAHTEKTNPGEQLLDSMARSKDTTTASTAEYEQQLRQYKAYVHSGATMPRELDKFIRNVVMADRPGPHSPTARLLAENAENAQRNSEFQAMMLLAPHLMFRSAYVENGERFMNMEPEALFHSAYVTSPDNDQFMLAQPKPDMTNGYIPISVITSRASSSPIDWPFTEEEEEKLLSDGKHPPIHPKSAKAGIWQGVLQTTRDGLAVIEYNYRLHKRAGVEPDAVGTCHWSMTVLGSVRWDGDENPEVVQLRKCLRNLLHYAQTRRLDRIKDLLKRIPTPTPRSGTISNQPSMPPPKGHLGGPQQNYSPYGYYPSGYYPSGMHYEDSQQHQPAITSGGFQQNWGQSPARSFPSSSQQHQHQPPIGWLSGSYQNEAHPSSRSAPWSPPRSLDQAPSGVSPRSQQSQTRPSFEQSSGPQRQPPLGMSQRGQQDHGQRSRLQNRGQNPQLSPSPASRIPRSPPQVRQDSSSDAPRRSGRERKPPVRYEGSPW